MKKDISDALLQLKLNFIDSNFERLDTLDQIIDDIYNKEGNRGELYQTLVQEIHSLKGNAGTFGFPFVSSICHRLEDYLESLGRLKKTHLLEVQKFIDIIRGIFEQGEDPTDRKHDAIYASLPSSVTKEKSINATVVLVMETGVIRTILGTKLTEAGVDVSFVSNPLDGIKMAIALKPDMVAASQQLASMTGIELAKVLGVIEVTKDSRFVLLTSNKDMKVPKGIDLIMKDNTIADQILELLKKQAAAE